MRRTTNLGEHENDAHAHKCNSLNIHKRMPLHFAPVDMQVQQAISIASIAALLLQLLGSITALSTHIHR
jgi:hypothetical protein